MIYCIRLHIELYFTVIKKYTYFYILKLYYYIILVIFNRGKIKELKITCLTVRIFGYLNYILKLVEPILLSLTFLITFYYLIRSSYYVL